MIQTTWGDDTAEAWGDDTAEAWGDDTDNNLDGLVRTTIKERVELHLFNCIRQLLL